MKNGVIRHRDIVGFGIHRVKNGVIRHRDIVGFGLALIFTQLQSPKQTVENSCSRVYRIVVVVGYFYSGLNMFCICKVIFEIHKCFIGTMLYVAPWSSGYSNGMFNNGCRLDSC